MKSVLWITLIAALTLAIRGHNLRDVFIGGHLYFVDADCYSRMTRAQIVDERPGTIVRWQEFENYPAGILPHTTAPLDYLIVALKGSLETLAHFSPSFRTSILARQMLDVAGALISPLLAVATVVFLSVWARWGVWRDGPRLKPWMAATPGFLFAVSPILVHGTLLGRPDHQSLLLLLVAVALGAEWVFAERRTVQWAITAGVAWGLALWVSVYEPLILLVGLTLLRRVAGFLEKRMDSAASASSSSSSSSSSRVVRSAARVKEDENEGDEEDEVWRCRERQGSILRWAAISAIVLVALLIERWHFQLLDDSLKEYFTKWASSIGELRHLNPARLTLYRWLGFLCLASPILLILAARRDRRASSVLGMLLLTFGLTCWQLRWGYFLALVFAMSLPWQLSILRWRLLAWPVLLISLWPAWKEWDEKLFPSTQAEKQFSLRRLELQQLRQVAWTMRSEGTQPFIAPWWLSPPLAYWSGQPGVAGSSHESLPGIVDTARFYMAKDPATAAAILRARNAEWAVAEDASRTLSTSKSILGNDPSPQALAVALAEETDSVPPFLEETPLVGADSEDRSNFGEPIFYRLYRVQKENLQP